MIRFSAFLVVVAVGLLVAGVVTSKLLLVYIAIGVSGVALLALGIGAAVNWRELTGKPKTDAAEASAQGPAPIPQAQSRPAGPSQPQAQQPVAVPQAPVPAASAPAAAGVAPAGSGWPAAVPSGPSRAGYLPAADRRREPSPRRPRARPAAFTPRSEAAARGVWQWRDDSVPAPATAHATRLPARCHGQSKLAAGEPQPGPTGPSRIDPEPEASQRA